MTQAFQAQAAYYGQPNGQHPTRKAQGLCFGVHAPAKTGKSCLCDSGPPPRFIGDLEGMSRWTPSRKVYWDMRRETCPTWPQDPRAVDPSGYWDSCIVQMRTFADLQAGLTFLERGQHPFNSVDLDSATEMQQRFADEMAPNSKLQRDHWYAMLRQVNSVLRGYRDLVNNPAKTIWSVAMVFGTKWDPEMRKFRPLLQGQSQDYMPYYPDVLGYLEARQDGTRHLLIGPHPNYETGERVGGRLPYSLQVSYPQTAWSPAWPGWSLEDMVAQVISS